MDSISDEFYAALSTNSTYCSVLCEYCGRTHFVDPRFENNYDDGEGDELLKKHNEDPDKYIPYSQRIDYAHVGGQQVVVDCPCDRLEQIEGFIWSHRHMIGRYFENKRGVVEKEHSQEMKTLNQKPPTESGTT